MLAPLAVFVEGMLIACTLTLLICWVYDNYGAEIEAGGSRSAVLELPVDLHPPGLPALDREHRRPDVPRPDRVQQRRVGDGRPVAVVRRGPAQRPGHQLRQAGRAVREVPANGRVHFVEGRTLRVRRQEKPSRPASCGRRYARLAIMGMSQSAAAVARRVARIHTNYVTYILTHDHKS